MRQRGMAPAVEWALLVPLVVALIGVAWAGARLAWARAGIQSAAAAGARAMSIESDAFTGTARAERVTAAGLAGLPCGARAVAVDASGFRTPVGTPASVSVRLRCTVGLGDLLVPGLPGAIDVEATGVAPLDTYRSRR